MWLIIVTGAVIHGTQPSGRPDLYPSVSAIEAARSEDECIYRARQIIQMNLDKYDGIDRDCVPTASIKLAAPH